MDPTAIKNHAEVAYQAERASTLGELVATPEYIFERYRRCTLWRYFPKELMFKRLHDIGLAGKEVLEFGCGEGFISTQLAKLGARVTAVDISAELIDLAKRRAELDGVRDRITFISDDLTQSRPRADQFDVVICHAVLHHVEKGAVRSLLVALKPGGLAIMVEPIAFSPTLQRLRDLVPLEKDVSPDERQLGKDEVDGIAQLLVEPEITYFNIFGRLSRLLPNRNKIDRGHPITKIALICLHGFDRLLLTLVPGFSRWSGVVVIVGRKLWRAGQRSADEAQPR
jgi:2-polyprenyl-3-methyl-5-hydroxy-6-metoxy-1,4-benzoquinol methylase